MSLETMTKLATYTVGSGGESSITFSNIPQTYTDLKILLSVRASSASGNSNCFIYLNGVTGTSYAQKRLSGNGSTVTSDTQSSYPWIDMINAIPNATYTTSTFGNAEIYIPNYTSNSYKSISIDFVGENNASTSYQYLDAGLFSSTNPITSLTIDGTDNFVQYSTATLYGIKALRTAVGNSIKATGGAIAFDGTYVTHTFNTTDIFTPTTNLLVDYLVVAGGGGGGGSTGVNASGGGGGGAGGLRSTVTATGGGGSLETALSLTSGIGYTVTVGAGGAGSGSGNGTIGNNSVFSTITSTAGGAGTFGASNGGNGGSGGGAGRDNTSNTLRTGGTGTVNQGYAGGNNLNNSLNQSGGGGGGAGAVGSPATGSSTGGNGGAGVTTSISGTSTTYAGGGGGAGYYLLPVGGTSGPGSGGSGGGANGGNAVAGTVNTGGGGGGGGGSTGGGAGLTGGAGGSGIVIVRYKG